MGESGACLFRFAAPFARTAPPWRLHRPVPPASRQRGEQGFAVESVVRGGKERHQTGCGACARTCVCGHGHGPTWERPAGALQTAAEPGPRARCGPVIRCQRGTNAGTCNTGN